MYVTDLLSNANMQGIDFYGTEDIQKPCSLCMSEVMLTKVLINQQRCYKYNSFLVSYDLVQLY